MSLTFGSLFSGIGGFDLGLEQAGLKALWQCEIDKDCQRVLKRHWPDTRLYNNVKEINRSNTASPDVLVGGFPCQDLSVAGKREGLAGERSGLWFEFHRIIAELKPRWVVIENVPGLLSSNEGRDFAVILRGLAECGYCAAWRVLDAQYFGVAQRRRRVFIVASLGNGSCAQILFESEGGAWDSPPSREKREGFAATITKRFGGASNQRPPINEADNLIAHSVRPRSGMPQGWNSNLIAFQQNLRDEVRLINGDGQIVGALQSELGMKQQSYIAFSESGPGWWRDGIGTLRERDYKDGNTALICNAFNGYTGGADDNDAQGNHLVVGFDSSRAQYTGDIAAPLRVNGAVSPGVNDGKPDNMCISGGFGVRRLTPTECERLQGFPDGHTEGQSDSARYRQLGNAVAVPCSEWIGRRIVEATD